VRLSDLIAYRQPARQPARGGQTAEPARLAAVDMARGLAIAQMVVYHFCYDLNHFGWLHATMTREPGWIAWRSAIVAQFLFLVGVSLTLRRGSAAADGTLFTWRWLQIAGCAALVSAGSALIFGPSWIWFGVLHFVVVAQLLVAPLRRLGLPNLPLGAALLVLGTQVQIGAFTPVALSWIGFSPVKPVTEDFVPLMLWIGVVVIGLGAGNIWQESTGRFAERLRTFKGGPLWPVAAIGRWPLTIYMVHQPLLFGVLTVVQKLRGR
jgi:uncharacterized membrane protein